MPTRAEPIEPKHIIDGMTARRLCRNLNQRRQPLSRNTFGRWRRERAFPAPIVTTESGVELWDQRAVLAWVKHQRITRKFRVARD
jgi:predicted DNA-binding transcriptional regulator AlpA